VCIYTGKEMNDILGE